jgi:subtilisin family serine protease/subtilisin-like proprotein convertase family protein
MKLKLLTFTGLSALAIGCAENASPAQPEPEPEHPKFVRVENPLPGEYIVVLEQRASARARQADDVFAEAQALVAGMSAKIDQQWFSAVTGFSAFMSADDARRLADDPRVAFVQENGVITLDATQTNATWGIDRIDQASLPLNQTYTYNADGSGVTAFVIDTGIRATHSNFGGRVSGGFTSINDGRGTDDCHGHGTHVAGTVGSATWGVAKNVQLRPVRVLNCQGSGTDAGVISGVDWVAANHSGPSVANMSLGGGASPALDTAIRNLHNAGVTVVVAAGNENQNACNVSPAREPLAITVGSTTQSDARSSFSNHGTCVDIMAPGSSITSVWSTSDTATNTISGTSMASPHVAGAAALYLSANPTATPAEVATALTSNATPNKVTGLPTGTPNLLLFMGFIGGQPGNQPPTASITAPASGSTVSGTITVSATASDSDGTVASVRFELPDGTTVTDTTAPYSTSWNTTAVANGSHVIRAIATDNLGTASSPATSTVTVQNGGGGDCVDGTFNGTGLPLAIPDNNATGVTSSAAVTGNGTVGSLSLSVNITHTYRGDLVVTLISPAGTEFVAHNRSGGSADNLVLTDVPVTAFNGQVAAGTWRLRVQDRAAYDIGNLVSWSVRIVGNCTPTTLWSASGTPNLPITDNSQSCHTVTVAPTTGLASEAKLDVSGTHSWRSILRGTLSHNGVTVAAFPTGTFPSSSGTFSFTNRPIAGLSGSAAGDWTLCIIDTDGYGDTGTFATWSVHN